MACVMARSRESKLLEERGHKLCLKEWAGDVNQETSESGMLPKNGKAGAKAEKKEWPRLISAKE